MRWSNHCRVLLSALVGVCAVAGIPGMVFAQTEQIPWSVISSGGVIGADDGESYMYASAGQTVIGLTDSTREQRLSQGFWVPFDEIASIDDNAGAVATAGAFELRNYPNPFSVSTTIGFRLRERSKVSLEVYDLLGRSVAVLFDGIADAGEHRESWDGMLATGERAGGGVYIYQLSVTPAGSIAATQSERRKLIIVR